MENIIESKPKRRRFTVGTLVESTNEAVNSAAHKFIVRVRYITGQGCIDDYIIEGPRQYLRE
jgi:hypothetical protein